MFSVRRLLRGLLTFIFLCFSFEHVYAADNCTAANGSQTNYSVNVKSFGAVGDGSTDDTAAIQRAVVCVTELLDKPKIHAAELYFPSGVYVVSNHIQINGNDPGQEPGSLSIRGDNMLASRIISNSKNGIFDISMANISTQVNVTQLGLYSNLEGGGTALSITMPSKGIIVNRAVVVRDLTIGGTDIHTTYFDTGIHLYATDRPLIEDVLMSGPYGPGSDGIGKGTCFDFHGSYSPTVADSACWTAQIGLLLAPADTGGRVEGIFITRSKFVNVDYGIYITNKDPMPEGMISENHINAHIAGLVLQGKKFVTVRDNLFYNQTTPPGKTYTDILLDNTEKIIISSNIFHFPGVTDRVAINIANSRDDSIVDNMFNQPGSGITIGSGVVNTRILNNRFFVQDLIKQIPLNTPPIRDGGIGTEIVSLKAEVGRHNGTDDTLSK